MKTTLIIAFVLCSLSLSSLGYGPFPLIRGQATTPETDTATRDRYEWNPMHVGDRWWYEFSDGYTQDVSLGREVLADTVICGETYYRVRGIAGGLEENWYIARGDSMMIYDAYDSDNNPDTSELVSFRWDLDEPGDTCWTYREYCGSYELQLTHVYCIDVFSDYGFEGEELTHKAFYLTAYDDEGWVDFVYYMDWIERYGPTYWSAEFGVSLLVACEIDGEFFGDPSVDIEEEEQPPEPSIHLSCFPNPFNDQATIQYNLVSEHASGNLSIYNLRGQLLRTESISGVGRSVWDGRDSSGKRVASGVYLCRIIDNQGNATTNKLMMIK